MARRAAKELLHVQEWLGRRSRANGRPVNDFVGKRSCPRSPKRCAVAQSKVRARGMSDLTRTVRGNEFAGGIT